MEDKILEKRKVILVDVASIDFDFNSIGYYKTCGYYYDCYNSKLYSWPTFNYYDKDFGLCKINNEITVIMNMKKKSLKFKKIMKIMATIMSIFLLINQHFLLLNCMIKMTL